jgi:thiol-disulfide isomerase/thioredoxin
MRVSVLAVALLLTTAHASVVDEVRAALESGNFSQAEARLEAYRSRNHVTPEYLEGLSWIGRAALAAHDLDRASRAAAQTEQLSLTLLKTRRLDSEPHLPIALGAAIEVQAQTLAARGQRTEAQTLLEHKLALYRNTSIRVRLQKNLNLISLTGKPAPALNLKEHLGPTPPSLAQLKGTPALLFFWAHWCGDCKAEAPVLARLKQEFGSRGLAFIAPTQRYGYAAAGEDATPAAELAYIEQVRQRYYSALLDVPVPISQENFNVYGSSTTPTLVLVDRSGTVRLYHPGYMPYDQLRAAIAQVVGGSF